MEEDQRKHTVLNKKIDDADKYTKNVRNSQIEFIKHGMERTEDFHYKLATLCAGAITFSISFISYVSTTDSVLTSTWLLFVSWFLLFLSLIGSLYRNYFHGNFIHYQLQKEYLISKISTEDLAKEMLENYPETTYNSYDGIENLIKASEGRKKQYTDVKEYNERKEKLYDFLWVNCMRVSHIGFVLGMLLMILFAINNLK